MRMYLTQLKKYQIKKPLLRRIEAIDVLKRNNPSPSGTVLVTAMISFVQKRLGRDLILSLPLASGLGAYGASKLLTNKKFLNKATQFAKEPSDTLARQIQKIVKEETGVFLQTLLKSIKEQEK